MMFKTFVLSSCTKLELCMQSSSERELHCCQLGVSQAVPTIQRQNIEKETIKSILFYQLCVLHANMTLEEELVSPSRHRTFLSFSWRL